MEFVMPRPSGALQLLGAVSRDVWRGLRPSTAPAVLAVSRHLLVSLLDEVSIVSARFAEQLVVSADGQPRANAASVCRWELGRLRATLEATSLDVSDRRHQLAILKRLDDAVTAAQILSAGYRFHSLDRICRGGHSLDDHFEALARLRVKLMASQE